jgi:hypothetical protein
MTLRVVMTFKTKLKITADVEAVKQAGIKNVEANFGRYKEVLTKKKPRIQPTLRLVFKKKEDSQPLPLSSNKIIQICS